MHKLKIKSKLNQIKNEFAFDNKKKVKENPSVFLNFLDCEKEITDVIESSKKIQSKITDFF